MANTGIRQLTTVVGGYAKRIWYSLNGTTPINELMSIDDAGKFKCASEQITGLAGTGNRMVVADSTGNLKADNKFVTSYAEGVVTSAPHDTWVVLMECPVGKIDIAISVDPFDSTIFYYSQAGFARGTNGTSVVVYIANGSLSEIRLNGNNIEAKQKSGATNLIHYRYSITNVKV
jgi:hypothetical protein